MGCGTSKGVQVLSSKDIDPEHTLNEDKEDFRRNEEQDVAVTVLTNKSSEKDASINIKYQDQNVSQPVPPTHGEKAEKNRVPVINVSKADSPDGESVTSSNRYSLGDSSIVGVLVDSSANATVLDKLQSIQQSPASLNESNEQGNLVCNTFTEQSELYLQSNVNKVDELHSAGNTNESNQNVLVPEPSGRPKLSDNDMFNNALRIACPATKEIDFISFAPKADSLTIEHSFYCLSKDQSPGCLIRTVTAMENITELIMSGGQCGPVAFRALLFGLTQKNQIKTLNLSDNMADANCSETLGRFIATSTSLEILDVSNNQLGKDALSRHTGAALRINSSLTELIMSNCGASDLHCLCESIRSSECSKLSTLVVSHNLLSDSYQFAIDLSLILESPECRLTQVDVTDTGIKSPGMNILAACLLNNKSLTSLKVGRNEIKNVFKLAEMFIVVSQHEKLKKFSASRLGLEDIVENDPEYKWPDRVERHSQLIAVDMADCGLNSAVMSKLALLLNGKLVNIEELDISNNNELSTEDIKLFDDMCAADDNQGNLKSLRLGMYEQGEKLPSIFSDRFKMMSALDVRKSKMNNTAIHQLARNLHGIETINLNAIKLSGSMGTLMKSFSKLSELHLSGCQLSDADCHPIVETIQESNLFITELDISVNRITETFCQNLAIALLSFNSHPLKRINLADNNIAGLGLDSILSIYESNTHESNIEKLFLSSNSIDGSAIARFFRHFRKILSFPLTHVDLKCQKDCCREEDIETIADDIRILLMKVESFDRSLPSWMTSRFTINLSGLGGENVPTFQALDCSAIRTDFANVRRPTFSLNDVLEISVGFRIRNERGHSLPEAMTFTSREWSEIVGKDAPAWLQVSSELKRAVYITHMPSTVTIQRLQALFEIEADCIVEDVFLVKDPIVRKPTGSAWVLLSDEESPLRAVRWFCTGEALMYGSPFIISQVTAHISDGKEGAAELAKSEIIRREQQQKLKNDEDRRLLEESEKVAAERAQYREAHPAYQNGRIS